MRLHHLALAPALALVVAAHHDSGMKAAITVTE